jgi:nucleoid-associated protein YgaU
MAMEESAKDQADAGSEWVLVGIRRSALAHRIARDPTCRRPRASCQVVVAVVPDQKQSEKKTLVMIAPRPGAATSCGRRPRRRAEIRRPRDVDTGYDESGHVTVWERPRPARWCGPTSMTKWWPGQAAADGSWRLAPTHRGRRTSFGSTGSPKMTSPWPASVAVRAHSRAAGYGQQRTLGVVRGDNLWNIARAHYGTGFQHTLIYGANKDQIRNPDLIYPGQVFTLPKVN